MKMQEMQQKYEQDMKAMRQEMEINSNKYLLELIHES